MKKGVVLKVPKFWRTFNPPLRIRAKARLEFHLLDSDNKILLVSENEEEIRKLRKELEG